MIIRNPAVCLAIGATAVVVIVAFMVFVNRKHSGRMSAREVLAEAAEIHRQDEQRRYDERFDRIVRAESDRWAGGLEAIPARACEPSDVTPEVPQGLYDGLPQDQITDDEREMP